MQQFRRVLNHRVILTSVLLILLGLAVSSEFSPHISHATTANNPLYIWGYNNDGQLGNGLNADSHTPLAITLLGGATPTAIADGTFHSMAIGKLYPWGYNYDRELGNGTATDSSIPVVVSLPVGVTPTKIAVGDNHNLAIR